MSDRPEGLACCVQPILIEPRTIEWLADVVEYIHTVAYSD
jgi:hypothetical protein